MLSTARYLHRNPKRFSYRLSFSSHSVATVADFATDSSLAITDRRLNSKLSSPESGAAFFCAHIDSGKQLKRWCRNCRSPSVESSQRKKTVSAKIVDGASKESAEYHVQRKQQEGLLQLGLTNQVPFGASVKQIGVMPCAQKTIITRRACREFAMVLEHSSSTVVAQW